MLRSETVNLLVKDDTKVRCNVVLKKHRGHFTCRNGEPIRVVITGARGQIAYSLIYPFASGQVFGEDQSVSLVLVDLEAMLPDLRSLVMELHDASLPILRDVVITADVQTAFTAADFVVMMASVTSDRRPEKDFLGDMVQITRQHAAAVNKHAKKSVKILVVSFPCHALATICCKYAPNIPPQNITSLTRLEQNRATGQIAKKAETMSCYVRNVIVLGGNSKDALILSTRAQLLVDGRWNLASNELYDDAWITYDLNTIVSERTETIQKNRPLSCSLSTTKAICDHIRDWWRGTKADEWSSMGVQSDGSYGVEEGLYFGFPVTVDSDSNFRIKNDLIFDPLVETRLHEIVSTLKAKRDAVLAIDSEIPASSA